MLQYLKQVQEKIDARILRERVLIFLSAAAIIFMLWNFIIQAPFDKKIQETQMELTGLRTRSTEITAKITEAAQATLNNPARLKKAQIAQLQADIDGVEAQLKNTSQSLIGADQLPQALQDVLQKTTQLTLLEVATLPMKELHFVSSGAAAGPTESSGGTAKQEENNVGVYEHVVELRVAGNYFQVIQFLTALETLPWQFYWQRLDYKVTQYPNAEIILRVYTLSSEEGLLGV